MIYLIITFTVLFLLLAWRRLDWAVMFLIAALPTYLIRFNIFGLPATLLEVTIWVVFMVWLIKNFSQIKNNFLENFKKDSKKVKIRYPFDWEIVLMVMVALAAAAVAGFSAASFGIWKAYFFEPALFFIVVFNVMAGQKGREKILWALAASALVVSLLAIYQKITGQLIGNAFWAAVETRRAVSFFGYPNAVGLYLGPIILMMAGWLASATAVYFRHSRESGNPESHCWLSRRVSGLRLGGRNDNKMVARNGRIAIIFISLTIILSLLSIYFAKSKGALMGVAAGLVMFGLLAGKKIRWAVIVILILAGLAVAVYQPARNLAVSNFTLTNKSGQIRQAGWADGWKMLKDGRLITGAGLANYQIAVAPYHTEGIFIKDFSDPDAQRKLVFNETYRAAHWQPLEIYLYPHNLVLNFWSELGLAGLLLFIWIILKYFWLGIANFKFSINKFTNIGLISAMVVIIVHGLVDVPYFKNDLAIMFWLFIAMMGIINKAKARINV